MHGIKNSYAYFMQLKTFYYAIVINSQQALNLG